MLPANIGQAGDNALSIAASSNKGTLIRYLNDQVEDGFYTGYRQLKGFQF